MIFDPCERDGCPNDATISLGKSARKTWHVCGECADRPEFKRYGLQSLYHGHHPGLLLLDVDGVLNSHAWFRVREEGCYDTRPIRDIDPEAVQRLDRLVRRTGAAVVVSSCWRHHYWPDLRDILAKRGFTGRLIGRTPDLQLNRGRGLEIDHWLKANLWPAERFCILDDHSDMEPHMSRLVKTSFSCGLTDEDCERAVEMLRTPCL